MIPSNKVLSIIIVVAISTILLSSSMVSGLIKTASIKIGIPLHLDNARLIQEVLAIKHITKTAGNQTTSTQGKAGGHATSRSSSGVYSPTGGCIPGGTECVPCDPGLPGGDCVWSSDWHPSCIIPNHPPGCVEARSGSTMGGGPPPKTLPLPTTASGKGLNLAKVKVALQGLETKGLIPLNTAKIFNSVLEGKASKSDRAALAFRICDSKLLFSKLKSKCDKLKSFNQPTPTGTIHPHNPIVGIVEACEANSACNAIVEDILDSLQDIFSPGSGTPSPYKERCGLGYLPC
jgi:hypothetical protein